MNTESRGELPEGGAGGGGGTAAKAHKVRIHIDREAYEAETPIAAAALYELADISDGFALFREVAGDAEDEFIPRDANLVSLTEDEHFYGQKDYRIIVNAREELVEQHRLSYEQVVRLGFNPVPTGPDIIFTVTYRKGPHSNPKGTLSEGESVTIKNGMIFVVTQTNRS